MFLKQTFYVSAVLASTSTLWGCGSGDKSSSTSDILTSMQKDIQKSGTPTTSDVSAPVSLENYSLLQEVCSNAFKTANYKFSGDKMRFKLKKAAYNLPYEGKPDAKLYRHQYGICFDFYPAASGEIQEALYVSYLGTISADVEGMKTAVSSVSGGYEALLADASFHTNLTSTDNGWPNVSLKVYSDETSAVQYLKMNPLDMKVMNKYGGQKYDNLMAFEFVHAFVTNVDGVIQFHNVTEATYSHVFA